MPKRPSVDELTEYYSKAMMTRFMRWLCRQSGKKKFTAKDIAEMKKTAELKLPTAIVLVEYGFYEYSDGSGYEGRFTKCGICVLMKELGLFDDTGNVPLGLYDERGSGATNFIAPIYHCVRRLVFATVVIKRRFNGCS